MRSFVVVALGSALAACGAPTPLGMLDGGPMPLVCATPMSIPFVASGAGSTAGVPIASIAWADGRCSLGNDERPAGLVLLVVDFDGTALGPAVVAIAGEGWVIVRSSTAGEGPASMIGNLPHDTDITVEMSRDGDAVSVVFRIEGSNLVLVSMHR